MKKDKIYGIIYKVTNKRNGKCYIGQTVKTLNERKSCHVNDAINKRHNMYFHKAIMKHGIDNFIWCTLCKCLSREELNYKELNYIKEFNTLAPNGYNLTMGGNGISGYNWTEEQKKNQSERCKGRIITNEQKEKQRISMMGKNIEPKSNTTKQKMSESGKIKIFTDEYRKHLSECKMGELNNNYGKHQSIETKRKNSEAHIGKTCSIETRQKMSLKRKGKMSYQKYTDEQRSKAIKLRNENITFNEISSKIGIPKGIIFYWCKR